MGVLDKFKKLYFAFEDKYYAVLDKINRKIPVYKLIDPIDKVVPSFALFGGLLLLLVLVLLSFGLPAIFPPVNPQFSAEIQVLSASDNEPIAGATVNVVFGEERISGKTNDSGIAVIELPSEEIEAEIEVKADGFGSVSKTALLKNGSLESFSLVRSDALFKPKVKIFVFNAQSNKKILDRTISIKFTCSNEGSPAPINAVQSEKTGFEAEVPEECGTLLATLKANGFKDRTVSLVSEYESATKNVMLTPVGEEVQTKGSLSVKVFNHEDDPVEGVLVKVTNSKTDELIASKYSKESGSAFFEKLDPGFFDVFCDALDGRTKIQKNVKIEIGKNSSVQVSLPAGDAGGASRKLFFKVKDADSGLALEGVRVVIKMDGSWFKSADTNEDGLPSVLLPVNSTDASKEFTATLSKEDYIMKIVDLPVLSKTAGPTVIELEQRTALSNFKPVALFTADKFSGVGLVEVKFDSSDSFDPDGIIESFEWDFGDSETSTEVNPEHSFDETGNYLVSLTVKDNDGAESTVSRTIQVLESGQNAAPVAFFSADSWFGLIPLEVEFDASDSFDSDGSIELFEWDFGDGETGEGETITHSFDSEGFFNVKLTVTDNEGETGEFFVSIQTQGDVSDEAGNLLVKVQNDSGESVEGALINLYREDQEGTLNDPSQPTYSNIDGEHLFENIPLSEEKYYAKASKDPGLFGESAHELVVAGQQTELVVTLTHGFGLIEAFVHKENEPFESVHVEFVNSSDGLVLGECETDSDGKCESGEIVSGTVVVVKASKANHLTAESQEIEILADNNHAVSLELFEETEVNGIKAELLGVFLDAQGDFPAASIESHSLNENEYYFKFNLLLEKDSVDINFAAIAGDFSVDALQSENYKIKILDISSNAGLELLSTCFDATQTFTPPSQCVGQGDSFKQATANWDTLGAVSKTIIVKTAIEPGLLAGDTAELRFAASAIQEDSVVSHEIEIIPIEISSAVCGSSRSIAWNKSIELNGEKISVSNWLQERLTLERRQQYSIYYSMLNCFDEAQDIDVNAWNEDRSIMFEGQSMEFGPFTVESINLESGAVSAEIEVLIEPVAVTDSTSVKLGAETSPAALSYETEFLFSVASDKSLEVNGLPNFFTAGIPVAISGVVYEAGTNTHIDNAIVTVKLNDSLIGEEPTSNVEFFIEQTSGVPEAGDIVYVFVSAPGYNDFSEQIPVRAPGAVSLLDCVELPSEPLTASNGANFDFTIVSSNCPSAVTINLLSMLFIETQNFGLAQSESKTVLAGARGPNVFQGIYPIEVKGTLEGAASQRLIGIVDVIVTDPNSCFSVNSDNFTLDLLNQTQSIEFENKCVAIGNIDSSQPTISSDNAGANFEFTSQKDLLPASVSIDWKINAFVEQSQGSSFDLQIVNSSATVNPQQTAVFELGTFSGTDAINKIKQHSGYAGGVLSNVRFVPVSNNENIEVWIEGEKIMGKYHGPRETTGKYNVRVSNTGFAQTGYGFATLEDYVEGGGD